MGRSQGSYTRVYGSPNHWPPSIGGPTAEFWQTNSIPNNQQGQRPKLGGPDFKPSPKAPCSFIVDTWALKGLPYRDFGVYVYTIKLHGAFG